MTNTDVSLIVLSLALFSFTALPVAAQVSSAERIIQQQQTEAQRLQLEENHRQQERARQLQQRQRPEVDVRLDSPSISYEDEFAEEEPCFVINDVSLNGNSSSDFQWALSSIKRFKGRCLGANGINALMGIMQDRIVEKGFITTRVLAEPQDLTSGHLALTLIPGRIRELTLAPSSNVKNSLTAAFPNKPGDLLNLRDIEQGLENLKRQPTMDADIQIQPGLEPGESDVLVEVTQARKWRVNVSSDDSGSKSTGEFQGAATVSLDNPLLLGDLFYYSFNHDLGGGEPSEYGTEGHSLFYSVPRGYWELSLSANEYDYRQTVAGVNQNYIYRGESRNATARASRLIYRDARRKTAIGFEGWLKKSRNFIDDTEVLVQRRKTAGWAVDINHREFLGTGILDFTLGYRRGTGALDALRAPEDDFDEGTARFKIITLDTHWSQPFSFMSQSFRYQIRYQGQWNRTPLTSQNRFSIGNRYNVRGFDGELSLSAERGWFVRNELGWAIPKIQQEFYVGLDYGRVGGASSDLLVGRELAGGVIGLRGGWGNFNYEVFASKPIEKPRYFNTTDRSYGFNFNWGF